MAIPTLSRTAALGHVSQAEELEHFAALRDSTDPHDAEQAMRLADELIQEFMGLVGAAVRKWRAKMPAAAAITGFDDLRAAGTGGLWEALLLFDPEQGTPFVGFASRYIGWAMSAEIRRADFLKKDARTEVQRAWRAVSALENRLGRAATEEEAANASGVGVGRYRQLQAWDQRSLTAELTDPLVNYLSGSGGGDPLERLCAVEEALEEMPTDDAEIAHSVRQIRQAVESIKGYFEGDLKGAA